MTTGRLSGAALILVLPVFVSDGLQVLEIRSEARRKNFIIWFEDVFFVKKDSFSAAAMIRNWLMEHPSLFANSLIALCRESGTRIDIAVIILNKIK